VNPRAHPAGGIRETEKCCDLIGNRSRHLPTCGTAPQPTTLPHAPVHSYLIVIKLAGSLSSTNMPKGNSNIFLRGQGSTPEGSRSFLLYMSGQPVWAYGIQLWGTASTSSKEMLQRFQSKASGMTADAPRYVPNTVIRRDFQKPTARE
jgi:hypothetical protein